MGQPAPEFDTRATDTVYILGAGLNQALGELRDQRPPMARNLLQVALGLKSGSGESLFAYRLDPLFEYIKKFWKLTPGDLAKSEFDLEDFFSFLDGQLGMRKGVEEAVRARWLMVTLLAEVLKFFETWMRSPLIEQFGRMLFRNRPTVLTFNYDTIVENAIVSAGGLSRIWPPREWIDGPMQKTELTDDELSFAGGSRIQIACLYGFTFDEVQIHGPGAVARIPGDRFYSTHRLYSWRILKLHGSLNWYRYTSSRSQPAWPGKGAPFLSEERARAVILEEGDWRGGEPPEVDGWYLTPVLIPPTAFKSELRSHPFYEPLDVLWGQARDALSRCAQLVVIGYSLPATDVEARNLLRDVFAETELEELIVVNPDDDVARRLIDLTHPRQSYRYPDLESYLPDKDWEDSIDRHEFAGVFRPDVFPWVADRIEFERVGRLEVALQVWMGAEGNIVHLRWVFRDPTYSTDALHDGWRFDVEVMRPGSDYYTGLLTGGTQHGISFRPDAGPGTYRFRMRPRFEPESKSGDWTESEPVLIGDEP